MKYKSVDSVDDEWDEALTTLEHCVTASSVIQDFEEITINCLNAIAFEEKLRSWSSALVVRVIRLAILILHVVYVQSAMLLFFQISFRYHFLRRAQKLTDSSQKYRQLNIYPYFKLLDW